MRLLPLYLLASVALAAPNTAREPIDARYFAATTVDGRRAILLEALSAVARLGHQDPVLVWRTGIVVGGLFDGDHPAGGLLSFERIGEAPLDGRVTWNDLGPHVAEVHWNAETMRVEWTEHIREFMHVPHALTATGRYRVRTHPDFHRLLSAEVEQKMGQILLARHIQGSELERHLVRAIWASHRERLPDLAPFLRRMIPLTCGEWLRMGLKRP